MGNCCNSDIKIRPRNPLGGGGEGEVITPLSRYRAWNWWCDRQLSQVRTRPRLAALWPPSSPISHTPGSGAVSYRPTHLYLQVLFVITEKSVKYFRLFKRRLICVLNSVNFNLIF
jgi:hypothetical protein